MLAAWRVLLLPKDASERRSGSDDLEKARAHGCRTYCSRGTRASERELPEAAALIHRHALERLRIPLPAVELAWGELEESTARCAGEDRTRRSGSSNGSGRSRTELTMLKIVVLAPMPSASTLTTATANEGVRDMTRNA